MAQETPLWILAFLGDRACLDSFLLHLDLLATNALESLIDAATWEDVVAAKGRLSEIKSLRALVENYREQDRP